MVALGYNGHTSLGVLTVPIVAPEDNETLGLGKRVWNVRSQWVEVDRVYFNAAAFEWLHQGVY